MVGVSYLAWQSGTAATASGSTATRATPSSPPPSTSALRRRREILDPETARSYEAGFKGRLLGGRFGWEVSAFQLDFENLVVAQARRTGCRD